MELERQYRDMLSAIKGLIEDEENLIANMANIAAVIYEFMPRINWAGFYLAEKDGLVLGPFQGKPACTHIPTGRGVCGKALLVRETVVVNDVHTFDDHIACDSASNSEIVVPIIKDGAVIGVLDIDSPEFARFGGLEKECAEDIVWLLVNRL